MSLLKIGHRRGALAIFKMDDCNLEKLSMKPGKLLPVFHMDVLEYSATLASSIEKVTFDCMTRDTGASYTISVRRDYCQGRRSFSALL